MLKSPEKWYIDRNIKHDQTSSWPKCPLKDKWIESWYIYTRDYYIVIKTY